MAEETKKDSPAANVEKNVEKKDKKSGKVGLFRRIANFFREYRSELKKVSWYPSGKVWHDTGVVVVALAICGVIIGVLDLAFIQLIRLLGSIG